MTELTQQVFEYVFTQYGIKPEYLWKTHPDYAVLRHADNRKWYAIVMNVEKSSLGLSGSGKLPVMNVNDPLKCRDYYNLNQDSYQPITRTKITG